MTFDFLPPQAYTKETLLKAYNWLQSQTEQVKELATTPDQLVSLFLKTNRLGSESLQRYATTNAPPPAQPQLPPQNSLSEQNDRPSLQSFKSELKNLAGMMGDLEKPPVVNPHSPIPPYQGPTSYQPQTQAPIQQTPQSARPPTGAALKASPSLNPANGTLTSAQYDEMTQSMIREVKNELNLSSDIEALRMLVKIGYQKVQSLYK
jgi:hypothetical protein